MIVILTFLSKSWIANAALFFSFVCILYVLLLAWSRFVKKDDRLPLFNITISRIDTYFANQAALPKEGEASANISSARPIPEKPKRIKRAKEIDVELLCKGLNEADQADLGAVFDQLLKEQGFMAIPGRNIVKSNEKEYSDRLTYRYSDKSYTSIGKLGKTHDGIWKPITIT